MNVVFVWWSRFRFAYLKLVCFELSTPSSGSLGLNLSGINGWATGGIPRETGAESVGHMEGGL